MTIKQILTEKFQQAMTAAAIPDTCQPLVARSTREGFGEFQANGAMAAAKQMKCNPRDLAGQIIENLAVNDIAEKVEIAGPGFINIYLKNTFLDQLLAETVTTLTENPQTIVVDYSAPNLAKEMHVGHLRSTIIGDALVRILEFQGHKVIRQNHMGDWGTQFGMLIAELEEHLGEGEQPELALKDLEAFYQQAKKHFDQDSDFADKARNYVVKLQSGDTHCLKLWQQFIDISVAHSEEIYRALNVTLQHDDIRPESAYNEALPGIISTLMEQGLAVEDGGAKVVFLDELADKKGQPSPVIIQKSDGGYLYATTDLAAIQYRQKQLEADRVLYFIDARQSLHMKQVFTVARKAGLVSENISLEHHPFGTMMGADGKPFKTRTGGTVKLAELLQEAVDRAAKLVKEKNPEMADEEITELARKVGIGSVKYADLSKTRTNDYLFSWDAMLSFEGNTAPYLQYAYTRIRSIFRRAAINPDSYAMPVLIKDNHEKTLALKILQFPEIIDQVSQDAMPHILCTYLYELASHFMSFYENCPILKENVPAEIRESRLQLSLLTANTLKQGLDLLGIEVMERM